MTMTNILSALFTSFSSFFDIWKATCQATRQVNLHARNQILAKSKRILCEKHHGGVEFEIIQLLDFIEILR
ncbi:hypothetical protein PAECIP112173_02711 [Paenibacillus sp. JJ-100]|nr:hypothetical protein PAECIP112173_02711 [Paenibacillus sp. JJ-100]